MRGRLGPGRKSLERGSTFSAERTPLKRSAGPRVSSLKSTTDGKGKRSGPISPASKEQRLKANTVPCIVTGAIGAGVDAAHGWPRGRGGCDDPDCTFPLRRDVHNAFDAGAFDVLPFLIAHGMWAEIAHPILAHGVDPIALLERLTNRRWVPTVVEQHPLNNAIGREAA